ncbi:hypothetical protein BCR32DRAFT_268198 [Anaeromyces robustus]|uniref:Uncharacterized protein n=1 Tax=Anaeromyces robustus TaxID=1754192 RepID=A0A1Y1X878_9FUNG|nr:hypothetical protein BCR32DRAFT_268198 [Anaeromyces robustus]|eukprot:ORX81606.1 hypothetical protein BCR32DRAFT_268198 [Anaeromyces robustus]
MDATVDLIILLFCLADISIGIYELVNAVPLISSKNIKLTYKQYFTEYNASLLRIIITLVVMCLSVAFINLFIIAIKNKNILKKYLKLYKVKKFNNSIFMFRIEKSTIENMIIRHEEDKVRKEKNSNSIWIILIWIILIHLKLIMIAIIIFFAYLNHSNANNMIQTAIFGHLSSKQYNKVMKINNKVNNIFYSSLIWIAIKYVESNVSWYTLGTC